MPRPDPRSARRLLLAFTLAAGPAFAADCPLPANALHDGAVQAIWAADPAPVAVGRHFTIRVQLCPIDAVLTRVDATMPAHRHGMNYRPGIKALGGGRWHVEGLMFHMPGQWELRLDIQSDGRATSLRDTVTLQ